MLKRDLVILPYTYLNGAMPKQVGGPLEPNITMPQCSIVEIHLHQLVCIFSVAHL